MTFNIDDLIRLAPPPERLKEAGSPGRWGEVERSLGTGLPSDYRAIIDAYGSGEFNDLFHLFNPFAPKRMSLLWQAGVPAPLGKEEKLARRFPHGSNLDNYRSLKAEFPESCPDFPTFPDPGGLLPLGGDSNGGSSYWLTEGRPDDWPLIFLPHGLEPVERHSMPLLEFLVLWLSGELPDCFGGAGQHFVNRTDPVFRPS